MARLLTHPSEVIDGPNEPLSEEPTPNSVDIHSGRQWVGGVCNLQGQRQSSAFGILVCFGVRSEDLQIASCGGLSWALVISPREPFLVDRHAVFDDPWHPARSGYRGFGVSILLA